MSLDMNITINHCDYQLESTLILLILKDLLNNRTNHNTDGIINGHCHTFCFYSCSQDRSVMVYTAIAPVLTT